MPKKILNTTDSALVPPNGPTIPAKSFRLIEEDEWEKKESNAVVKAWIAAGALVVSNGPKAKGDEADGPEQGAGDQGNGTPAPAVVTLKTEAELNELTNDQIKALIEGKNGEVKASWNKPELVKQALELKV